MSNQDGCRFTIGACSGGRQSVVHRPKCQGRPPKPVPGGGHGQIPPPPFFGYLLRGLGEQMEKAEGEVPGHEGFEKTLEAVVGVESRSAFMSSASSPRTEQRFSAELY